MAGLQAGSHSHRPSTFMGLGGHSHAWHMQLLLGLLLLLGMLLVPGSCRLLINPLTQPLPFPLDACDHDAVSGSASASGSGRGASWASLLRSAVFIPPGDPATTAAASASAAARAAATAAVTGQSTFPSTINTQAAGADTAVSQQQQQQQPHVSHPSGVLLPNPLHKAILASAAASDTQEQPVVTSTNPASTTGDAAATAAKGGKGSLYFGSTAAARAPTRRTLAQAPPVKLCTINPGPNCP
uniref:Uncharacterized protein n=1 Tax=Chlamydomonas leiostraca TaxID=1034604 RepID=A0A7S0R965_9CHLO